jgi:3'(2'), 5'-bisphosphate nucleotidase
MDFPYPHEIAVAISALRHAAHISQALISRTHNLNSAALLIHKSDLSPVTVADFAIQALLSATFHAHFPSDTLVGEESAKELRQNPSLLEKVWGLLDGVAKGLEQNSEGSSGDSLCRVPHSREETCDLIDRCGTGVPGPGRAWVFDPIDGTKPFLHGHLYAINIALLQDGDQILSAVACPNLAPDISGPISDASTDPSGTGIILFAAKGQGTFLQPLFPNSHTSPAPRRVPIHARTPQITLVGSNHTTGLLAAHQSLASRLGTAFPGCDIEAWVIRYVALALGLGSAAVWVYHDRERRSKTWDHAGAQLLFEEVGGKITDVRGMKISFSGRTMEGNFGIVAALEGEHEAVLGKVQEVLREQGKGDWL